LSFLILLVIVLSVLLIGFRKCISGADQGFIEPSGGRREKFWGISCEKSRFLRQKIIFFRILEGAARAPSLPVSTPAYLLSSFKTVNLA
jgi:hypothetical protein